jgi:hypothetical protein
MQQFESNEPQRWVPLVAYRIDRDEDIERLARAIVLGGAARDPVSDDDRS